MCWVCVRVCVWLLVNKCAWNGKQEREQSGAANKAECEAQQQQAHAVQWKHVFRYLLWFFMPLSPLCECCVNRKPDYDCKIVSHRYTTAGCIMSGEQCVIKNKTKSRETNTQLCLFLFILGCFLLRNVSANCRRYFCRLFSACLSLNKKVSFLAKTKACSLNLATVKPPKREHTSV